MDDSISFIRLVILTVYDYTTTKVVVVGQNRMA